ncbi:acetolactate synthase large subunit [Halocatena marina]|uniref:acetolactate synthase large subunit n=1 Tax=Halocatena marina TaxID=2934937 RepID=UPI00200ECE43|nr:acetolactate synthase large subunit [Halocatena marina]
MQASDLLVECLKIEDVERVFGLPGEELEDVLFSLSNSSIEFIPVRHEQGAAFMADVHGRLTGEAGVCLSTLGPGATNLLTGVADAHLDKSPVVAITGQGNLERMHKESHQSLDIVSIFEPITKWNTQIDDPDTINEAVRKAFKLAEFEKPGATHIEIPEDIAASVTGTQPLESRKRVRRPSPDATAVEMAGSILSDAEKPVILAGNGAVRTRSAEQLRSFIGETEMPVIATYMGKGAVSDADDHSLMTLDSGSRNQTKRVIESADTVLAVGYDIAEHDPERWNPDLNTRIVHLDFEPAEVYEHYNPEVEIVCDISAGLRALSSEAIATADTNWYNKLRESIIEEVTQRPEEDDPVTVRNTLPYLRDVMDDTDVLISDVGSHKMAIAQSYPTYEPNTCLISNGLASMGIAVPGAIAADLAVDEQIVAVTGDGGFMMNSAELETATRLDLGFTVIIFNDNDYGLISEKQRDHTGESFGTRLTNPDFVAYAESFGIDAYRPDSWTEIHDVLQATIPSDELSLVEIRIE